jgi:hypothetical protein
MPRVAFKWTALGALGFIIVLGYSLTTHSGSAPHEMAHHQPLPAARVNPFARNALLAHGAGVSTATAASTTVNEQTAAQTYPADIVATWAAETTEPKTRAAQINALAMASPAQAVPVLQRVLGAGDYAERQLALTALRTLAQRHGDASGSIREVLRQAVFHDDGEAIAGSVQTTMQDIERNFSQPAP